MEVQVDDPVALVAQLQAEQGWTNDEVGALLGLSAPYWSLLRSGQRRATDAVLLAIATAFPDLRGAVAAYAQARVLPVEEGLVALPA